MTIPIFEKLLNKIRPQIQRRARWDVISPEQRLVITLRYLSQGTSMQALAWNFQIAHATVHQINYETDQVIWETLSPEYLKFPSSMFEWLRIEDGFSRTWHFPHCLGNLDGKHVRIQAPAKSGCLYYNYKNSFSIVLMATCNSQYRFIYVDIGAYGSQSDGGIFKNSVFGQSLEEANLNIQHEKELPNSNIKMTYFLVADEAFPPKKYIMRPYGGKNLTFNQKIFNYRLSRARQTIENIFGILVARWRILKTTINAKPENVDNIIKAVTVLHNYCLIEMKDSNNMYCPPGFTDSKQRDGTWRQQGIPLKSVGRIGANYARVKLYTIKDQQASYFVLESGSLIWQEEMINRGRVFN